MEHTQDNIDNAVEYLAKIEAMPDTGYVMGWAHNSLFVGRDKLWATGLVAAEVITDAQFEAMAKYGVGLPPVTNGAGERATRISLKVAKAAAVEEWKRYIEILRNSLPQNEVKS